MAAPGNGAATVGVPHDDLRNDLRTTGLARRATRLHSPTGMPSSSGVKSASCRLPAQGPSANFKSQLAGNSGSNPSAIAVADNSSPERIRETRESAQNSAVVPFQDVSSRSHRAAWQKYSLRASS